MCDVAGRSSAPGQPRATSLVRVTKKGNNRRTTPYKKRRGSKLLNELPHAEKRAKTIKKATRSPFLAPFRADRATAMSDIVVRIVIDGLRH